MVSERCRGTALQHVQTPPGNKRTDRSDSSGWIGTAPGKQHGLQDCERRQGLGYLAFVIVDVGPSHHQSGPGADDARVRGQESARGGSQVIDLHLGSRARLAQQPEDSLAQHRVRQREDHGLVNSAVRIAVVRTNLHAHGGAVVVEFDEFGTDEILEGGSRGRQPPLSRMALGQMPGGLQAMKLTAVSVRSQGS